jgi:hypothetical protein
MDGDAVMSVIDAEADGLIGRGWCEAEAKDGGSDVFPEFPLCGFYADITKTPKLHEILQFIGLIGVIGAPLGLS